MYPMIHRPLDPLESQDPEDTWQALDDFMGGYATGHISQLGWVYNTIAGAGGSWFYPALTTDQEHGVVEMRTGAANGDRFGIAGVGGLVLGFPVGTVLKTKFKLPSVADLDAFIGLGPASTIDYRAATNTELVGFRIDRAVSANIFAVIKNGVSPAETLLDMGAADTDWHTASMSRPRTDAILVHLDKVLVGSMAVTNVPAAALLRHKAAVGTLTGATKSVYLDFWFAGGPRS